MSTNGSRALRANSEASSAVLAALLVHWRFFQHWALPGRVVIDWPLAGPSPGERVQSGA